MLIEINSNTTVSLRKCLIRLSGAAARTGRYQGKERNKNVNTTTGNISTKKGGEMREESRCREQLIMETL